MMDFLQLLHFFTSLDAQLGSLIAAHGDLIYVLLFAIVLTEIGFLPLFFLPGDPLIFISGSFCKVGSLNLIALMLTLSVAAFIGNLISYKIGSLVGKKVHGERNMLLNKIAINKKALARTHLFYAKYGQLTLLISPFIAVIRTFAPFLAGVSNMPFRKYMVSSSLGTTFWIVSLTLTGYLFSDIPFIRNHMASIVLAGLSIGLACVIIGAFFSRKQQKV